MRRAALQYCVHRKLQISTIGSIVSLKCRISQLKSGKPKRKETW